MPTRVCRQFLVIGQPSRTKTLVAQLEMLDADVVVVEPDERALTVVRAGDFDAVFVNVSEMDEWVTCGRVAAASDAPVAVVTHFLAEDRRYRDFAFRARVAAYIRVPYRRRDLQQTLVRLRGGEREIEVIGE